VGIKKQRVSAVKDYNEFCQQWKPDIQRMVVDKKAFQFCDVDDVVQELIISLYEKDVLYAYDSSKGAKFSTFIYGFVSRSLLGKRDKYERKTWREGISLVNKDTRSLPALKKYLPTFNESLEAVPDSISVEFIDLVKSVYQELKNTPVTSAANDFPRLFSSIVQQLFFGLSPECALALGETEAHKSGRYGVNRKALAFELGISETGVSVMLTKLGKLPAVKALLP